MMQHRKQHEIYQSMAILYCEIHVITTLWLTVSNDTVNMPNVSVKVDHPGEGILSALVEGNMASGDDNYVFEN